MTDDHDYQELSEKTVSELKEYVQQHDVDVQRLLKAERQNKDRKTMKNWLESHQEGTTSEVSSTSSTTTDTSDGVSIHVSTRQAFIASFLIGVFVGGFFMAGIFSVSGADGLTGAFGEPADDPSEPTDTNTGDDPSDPDSTDDQGSDTNDGSSRVSLSGDMLTDEPTLGPDDAPVTIVEYSDYGCPWCAEWAGYDAIPQRPIDQEQTLDKIKSNYVESGDVRFVFKDYPVSRLHPNAPSAHKAANCVLEQGQDMYWEYHDLLFEQRDSWTAAGSNEPDSTFSSLAEQVGADTDAFQQCYDSSDGSESQGDRDQIHQVDGRLGTPTMFIGNTEDGFRKVEGAQPYSSLEPLIQSELESATS